MENTSSSLPVIEMQARSEKGTRANNRFRNQGMIPTVVYHRGEESIDGLIDYNDFIKTASQSTSSQVFALKSKDARLDGRTCLVKEVQKNFVAGKLLHVDFQSLKDDEQITVRIPLRITGEPYGVKNEGGILTVAIHDLGVTCFPRQIPKEIVVDVSGLHLGKSIHASALQLPENVELDDDADETIASVVAVRAVEETTTTAAAAEGDAAAAPAAGAAGAAPAAAGAAAAGAGDKKDAKKK